MPCNTIKISNVVCNIIDYKFRYLEHRCRKRGAMTNRGEFYVWKKYDASWRTIRKRWQESKYGAVFLYVSEKLGLTFLRRQSAWPRRSLLRRFVVKRRMSRLLESFLARALMFRKEYLTIPSRKAKTMTMILSLQFH